MYKKILASVLAGVIACGTLTAPVVFAEDSAASVTGFYQDFENPDYHVELNWKKNTSSGVYRNYISNGSVAKASLAAVNLSIVDGTYNLTEVDGDIVTGGLEGYTGMTGMTGFMPAIYNTMSPALLGGNALDRANIPTLFVLPDNKGTDNHGLYVELIHSQGYNHAVFGKDELDLYGKKSKLTFSFMHHTSATGMTSLSITKNTKHWAAKYNEKAVDKGLTFDHTKNQGLNSSVEITDVVVIHNGKAYIGNGITDEFVIDDSKYICDVPDVEVYYTADVYLDYTTEAPGLVVVIKDDEGNMLGYKKGLLPIAKSGVTSVNAVGKAGVNSLNPFVVSNGVNYNVPFKPAQSDTGYGAYVFFNTVGSPVSMYLDNFGVDGYSDEDVPTLELVTAVDNYLQNPVPFLGEQILELDFNMPFAEGNSEDITVTDATGGAVNCIAQCDGSGKISLVFPDGLKASSIYNVNISGGLASSYGVSLGKDMVMVVRTLDNLNIKGCVLSGATLDADISNQSADPWNIIVIAAVKNNSLLASNRLYYKAANLQSGEEKIISVDIGNIADGDEVEVFIIDSFKNLRAFSDLQIIK